MHRIKHINNRTHRKKVRGGIVVHEKKHHGYRYHHTRHGGKILPKFIYSDAQPLYGDKNVIVEGGRIRHREHHLGYGGEGIREDIHHGTKTVLNEINKALGNLKLRRGKGVIRRIP